MSLFVVYLSIYLSCINFKSIHIIGDSINGLVLLFYNLFTALAVAEAAVQSYIRLYSNQLDTAPSICCAVHGGIGAYF